MVSVDSNRAVTKTLRISYFFTSLCVRLQQAQAMHVLSHALLLPSHIAALCHFTAVASHGQQDLHSCRKEFYLAWKTH